MTKKHVIKTGKDGELDGTKTADIDRIVENLSKESKIVIHLHGGLVSETKAMAKARELTPEYSGAGAYPVFFIYRTDLLSIVRNNLHEISKEKIFKKLSKKLLKYAAGKLNTPGGAKAAGGLDLPRDLEVAIEYKKLDRNEEPYRDIKPVDNLKELTEIEEQLFIDDLATDINFQMEVQAIVDGATDDHEKIHSGSKGATVRHRVSSETLMSPDVVSELVEDARAKDGKGIFSKAKLVVRAGKVLARVIRRFVKNRDHGLHPTIVEELAREFYLANIGATVWNMMKKETRDTFEDVANDTVRGGRYFVDALAKMLKDTGATPEISIVAHSLGSVFACNLLADLHRARKDATHPLPKDFSIKNLFFLAPAVEHEVFADTLRNDAKMFDNFRMYNLSDKLEAGYWEVPVLYSRSLLYLVSGAFEETDDGDSAFDRPLVGMERYNADTKTYKMADVKKVRTFLAADPKSTIWSIEDRGVGLASDAVRHGGFDDGKFKPGQTSRRATLDSILHVLANGM